MLTSWPTSATPPPHPQQMPGGRRVRWRAALLLASLLATPSATAGAAGAPAAVPGVEVCVIAPRLEAGATGHPRATLPLSRPTIFVRDPLAGVRLVRGGRVLWQRQAAPGQALQGPIAWPLAPLRAGERLQLQLQPTAAAPDAYATVDLQAAPAAALARGNARLAALGTDPQTWQRAVEEALQRGEAALATALLFAFEGPSAPDLDALRLEAFQRSCR